MEATKKPIYLDYHSTTPVDPRVLECMLPFFTEHFGNASSKLHAYGLTAFEKVEEARAQIAQLVGSEPGEVLFTSGATEAINLALQGAAKAEPSLSIVTWNTEHSAVLETARFLQKNKPQHVKILPVRYDGLIDLDEFRRALNGGPKLISVAHGNNEIGTIQPVKDICRIAKEFDALVHVDCAQTAGKIPVSLRDWNADFISISGHKFYGPKGIGALIARRRIPPLKFKQMVYGGGQERGYRAGTLNVPGVVGMGAAAELAGTLMNEESVRMVQLRKLLLDELLKRIPEITINGCMDSRLPGNLNISIPGIRAEFLLAELKNHLAVSSGSACNTQKTSPSHVLKSIGLADDAAFSSLRFGLGRFTTREEILSAVEIVTETVAKIKV